MKRTACRTRKAPVVTTDLGFDRFEAPLGDLAALFEDYTSEDLVDYDDERDAVDGVVTDRSAP